MTQLENEVMFNVNEIKRLTTIIENLKHKQKEYYSFYNEHKIKQLYAKIHNCEYKIKKSINNGIFFTT